jgi:hypothetical protein
MRRRRVKPLPYDPPPPSAEDLLCTLSEPQTDSAPAESCNKPFSTMEDKPNSDEAAAVTPKPPR